MKQPTSFRLTSSTLVLLKQLAEMENRSLTNMLEKLIIDRAKLTLDLTETPPTLIETKL